MATALYNRYRPRTFAEVVGQEHVTSALIAALTSGRTHHAYLFSGPRGCGKTSSARILAASLNCVHGPTPTPCGVCEQCTSIRDGSSIDVVEIDAASHGGVDDARDLRERALYVPASARFRVFVIDEAHQVSRDGFNALLKIVEEPPDHVVFVFATTEPEKVLPTIRSRTFSYQFRLAPPAVLQELLARICAAEGATLEPEVLPLVVRAGAGSFRDGLSVLDQLIAGGVTQYAQAAALLGVTDAALLDAAVKALSERNAAGLFGTVESVVGAGHDPRAFARDLLERLRDLLLIRAVPEAAERGLVDGVPPDQLERMRHQAASLGAAELSRAADVVAAGLVEMRGTTSPRLQLELVCARLLLPSVDIGAASLAARLDAVERRLSTPAAHAPAAETPPPAPVRQAPALGAPAPAPGAPGAPNAAASALPVRVAPPQVGHVHAGVADSGAEVAAPAPQPGPTSAPQPGPAPAGAAAAPPPAPEARPAPGEAASTPPQPGPAPEAAALPPTEQPAPVATSTPLPTGSVVPQAIPADPPGALDAERLQACWPLVLDAVKKRSRVPYAVLSQHAEVAGVDGQTVTVAITLAPIARQFQAGPGPEVLAEALGEVVGGSWRVLVTGISAASAAVIPPVEGFAPGDGPDDRDVTVDVTDPPDIEGSEPAADLPPSPPPREHDPVAFAREAFGATVISDTES